MIRFGALQKAATYAIAVAGLSALVLTGELGSFWPAVIGVAILASWFSPDGIRHRRGWIWAWNAVTVAFFGLQVVRAVLAGTILTPAVEFAAYLQINRLWSRRSARDDVLVNVLAFGHLIAATVLDTDLTWALCFAAFVVLAPWSMVLAHLRREIERNYGADGAAEGSGSPEVATILRSRRIVAPRFLASIAALSVPAFVGTALVFLFFPRLGFGLIVAGPRWGSQLTGFSDRIELGDFGLLEDDPTVVARVTPLPAQKNPPRFLGAYLRGTAFDAYDGRAWRRTQKATVRVPVLPELGWRMMRNPSAEYFLHGSATAWRPRARLRVALDPIDPPVLFVTPDTRTISIPARIDAGSPRDRRIGLGAEDEVRHLDPDDLGLIYTLNLSSRVAVPEPPDDLARYLEVPRLSPRVFALADRWTAGATDPAETARRIVDRLRSEYRYSREGEGGEGDPLERFLFDRKEGHCEYFSTALAILLRTQGVPTRNVSGFSGGTWNEYGHYYAVRQSNAHSWVEAWLPRIGWATLDATPPSRNRQIPFGDAWDALLDLSDALKQRWQEWVVTFDLGAQISIFREARRWLGGSETGERGARPDAPWTPTVPNWAWIAVGLAFGAGALFALRLRRRSKAAAAALSRRTAEVALYEALDRALAKRGHERPRSRTPAAHAGALRAAGFDRIDLVEGVTDAYQSARFGGRSLSAGRIRSLRREIRRLV